MLCSRTVQESTSYTHPASHHLYMNCRRIAFPPRSSTRHHFHILKVEPLFEKPSSLLIELHEELLIHTGVCVLTREMILAYTLVSLEPTATKDNTFQMILYYTGLLCVCWSHTLLGSSLSSRNTIIYLLLHLLSIQAVGGIILNPLSVCNQDGSVGL